MPAVIYNRNNMNKNFIPQPVDAKNHGDGDYDKFMTVLLGY